MKSLYFEEIRTQIPFLPYFLVFILNQRNLAQVIEALLFLPANVASGKGREKVKVILIQSHISNFPKKYVSIGKYSVNRKLLYSSQLYLEKML